MLCQSPVTCSLAEGVRSKIIFARSADEHRENCRCCVAGPERQSVGGEASQESKTASNDADPTSMILRLSVEGQLVTLKGFIARTPPQAVGRQTMSREWQGTQSLGVSLIRCPKPIPLYEGESARADCRCTRVIEAADRLVLGARRTTT